MKNKADIWGVWARETKTFYYLESGAHSISNPVDRILNILITKEVIMLRPTKSQLHREPYKLMTLAEAEEKEYTVETIYLNKIVEDQAKKKQEHKLSGWQ